MVERDSRLYLEEELVYDRDGAIEIVPYTSDAHIFMLLASTSWLKDDIRQSIANVESQLDGEWSAGLSFGICTFRFLCTSDSFQNRWLSR